MKKLLFVALLLSGSVLSFSQSQDNSVHLISIDSVNSYVGKTVMVTSKVYGVKETGKVAFINLGASFPNAKLTLFISTESLSNFKEVTLSSLDGKELTVTGKVETYKNKPQIILKSPDQLTVTK